MARPLPAVLLALSTLLAAAPLASAAVGLPPPAGKTERITSYYWQKADVGCHPYDQEFGLLNFALPSEVSHQLVPGGTRYDFHIESLMDDPDCPTLDFSVVSPLAPWPSSPSSTQVTSPCGTTGWLQSYPHSRGHQVFLYLDVPAGCGAGVVGSFLLYANVQPLHPSEYMACVPVELVLTSCAGAADEREERYACPNGQRPARTYVWPVVDVRRDCDFGTGEDYVGVGPTLGMAWIEARASSCTATVSDDFFGLFRERLDCPPSVGAVLYGIEWGNVLP